jgi:hypothetical protein
MRRNLALAVIAVSLVAGACGGGGGGSKSAYCNKLRDVTKEAQRSTSTSANGDAALRLAFEKSFDRIATKAPGELKDDFAILREYIDLIFQQRIDPGKADTKRMTELGTKYTKASRNISDYNTKVCKVTPTTPPTRATVITTPPTTTAPTVTTVKR